MRVSPRDIDHAYSAIDSGHIGLLLNIMNHGDWRPYLRRMAVHAASRGEEDITIYLVGVAEDIDTIKAAVVAARSNHHMGLYSLLLRSLRNA